MARPILFFVVLVLCVGASGCGPDPSPSGLEAGTNVIAEAQTLLDTDRPWSAARLLRGVLEDDPAPDVRLLAARAEAGAENWERVRTLLDGVGGLDSLEGGRGLYLLARADDHAGEVQAALEGYDAFLNGPDISEVSLERDAAQLRRALALSRLDPPAGADALEAVDLSPGWRAVLTAEALAREGATDQVEGLARQASGGAQRRRMWAARVEAARRAGDVEGARALAERAYSASGDSDQAQFALTAGRLAEEAGDQGASLYRLAIEADPASPGARGAAARLRQGDPTPADWLAIARTDRALGLNSDAADAFLQWLEADQGTPDQQSDVRYEAADALFDGQRYDDVEAVLAPIMERTDARELWAGTLGRMGRADEAAEIYLDLARSSPAPNLYFAADVLQQGGETEQATDLYRRIEREHPGRWAGLAVLRLAGQVFLDGDFAEAAALWDGYRGQETLRAQYWAGRALAEAGDLEAADSRFRSVRSADRESYYALLASQALKEPFWPIPFAPSPPVDSAATARVSQALRGIDVLREAGFPEVANSELDRAVVGGGQAERYALAEALIERGYGQRAIRLGQSLGGGTNERRMRILYPFAFRRMIASEAQASGVDPFTAAALIRQESQFSARATSYVGARGLMQLMPATGRTLADEVGIEDWDPALLYLPEVNVHLGTRYVGQQAEAYDGSLPAVFGAYNAGPHQIDAWRAFPEFGQDALFTERIPFRETRDYVKILTRNRAIYQGLYGAE